MTNLPLYTLINVSLRHLTFPLQTLTKLPAKADLKPNITKNILVNESRNKITPPENKTKSALNSTNSEGHDGDKNIGTKTSEELVKEKPSAAKTTVKWYKVTHDNKSN